jgi:retinol dehydrogenase-12
MGAHSGVYAVIDKLTSQGFDMQFGTNVLGMSTSKRSIPHSQARLTTHAGHFYLTKLLLPLLTATAKSSPPGSVRVVNVSSIGHHMPPSGGIQWPTLSPGDNYLAVGKKVGATTLYNQSKLVMRQVSSDAIRSLIYSSIGQRALLERTRSTIR